ncbi:MAG: hypothetical protein ACI85O_002587 [Saprospiraceae bacterium]|jgi:hypothetical protein
MDYHIVRYEGQFGFIKPWTAVRDAEIFSQQFLTPSIVAGMERKLFPELLNEPFGHYKILRHRLSYSQMVAQVEQIQPRGWNSYKKMQIRKSAILNRSVLLNPVLFLVFEKLEDAEKAATQHLCLCRNEDIMFPKQIIKMSKEQFDTDEDLFAGYELIFEKEEQSFLVGYNRFDKENPMYGWLKILGNPVKTI